MIRKSCRQFDLEEIKDNEGVKMFEMFASYQSEDTSSFTLSLPGWFEDECHFCVIL